MFCIIHNLSILLLLVSIGGEVHSKNILRSGGGWESTTTAEPPTTGWSSSTTTTPPPTTLGWESDSTEEPTSGWGSEHARPAGHTNINVGSELGIVGSGTAVQHHGEQLHVSGNEQVPGEASFGVGGDTALYQDGSNTMSTDIEPNGSAMAINTLNGGQSAQATENLGVIAGGVDVSLQSAGNAGSIGVGVIEGVAHTILSNDK